MREYLFRGKRKDRPTEWVYGYYMQFYYEVPHGDYTDSKFGHFILPLKPDGAPPREEDIHYEVIPETVGEYIGLEDNKDIKIFIGDIVKAYDDSAKDPEWGLDKIHIGVIEYTPDCYSLKIPGKLIYDAGSVKQWENYVYLPDWSNAENIEVIGSIHDNPELLK